MTYSAWVFEIDDTEFDGIHVNTLNYVKRGPYVWNEKRSRDEIEFEQNENVSFVQKKEFEFNPNRSCEFCHKNDFVHVYNPLHVIGLIDWILNFKNFLSPFRHYLRDLLIYC